MDSLLGCKKSHVRIVVLFGNSGPSIKALQPTHTSTLGNPGNQIIEYTYKHHKKAPHIILLQTVDAEGGRIDLSTFGTTVEYLQYYMQACLDNQKDHSFSAVYLFDPAEGAPDISMQCSAGAVHTACTRLNIETFWIAPLTPEYASIQALKSNPGFCDISDFEMWNSHLPHSNCRSIFNLLNAEAAKPHPIWKAPQDKLTKATCDEIAYRYTQELTAKECRRRKELHERLQEVQDLLTKEKHAAAQVEQSFMNAEKQYYSLLDQLSLVDNTEEKKIRQSFEHLSGLIDQYSIDISQTLSEDLLQQLPDTRSCYKGRKNVQHSTAPSSNQLLLMLCHAGPSIPTADFLEMVFGAIICWELHWQIFQPFYPRGGSQAKMNDYSTDYSMIRRHFPQMQAAKWRIDTLMMLMEADTEKQNRAASLASECKKSLQVAFRHLTGGELKLGVDSKLQDIFQKAWDLNHYIKTKATHSGDYQTVHFPCGHTFDESMMEVLDADPGDAVPSNINVTCGLGLKITNAIGGQKDPESKVLLKATVVGSRMYEPLA
ncbi:hypothetical protein BDV93DRAFT_557116 [Ceratobasidium sp. AG-I]|nr:hypothetical protein BDV93DRAFT_557116 [Ceratobasidium sp. AG-I]